LLKVMFRLSETHQLVMSKDELCCSEGHNKFARQQDAKDESTAAGMSIGLEHLSESSDAEDSLSQGSFNEDSDDECIFPDCQVNDGELPSIGSEHHSKGTCRPCSFFQHRKCRLGKKCRYCHLPHPKSFKDKGGQGIGEVQQRSQQEVARRKGANTGRCKISL